MKKLLATLLAASLSTGFASAEVLLDDHFDGAQKGKLAPTFYWYGSVAKGGGPQYANGGGKLLLGNRYIDTRSNWSWASSAVPVRNFSDIGDAGGFEILLDIESLPDVNASITVGVGEELGTSTVNFRPADSADYMVTFSANGDVTLLEFDNGTVVSRNSYSGPELEVGMQVGLRVTTDSTAMGEPASLSVLRDGDIDPSIGEHGFSWDGGNNYINVAGSGGEGSGIFYVGFDRLQINDLKPATVQLDVRKYQGTDSLNVNDKGKVRVWVLSESIAAGDARDFNPDEVDISTVSFGPNDTSVVKSRFRDVNGDGIPDLRLLFKKNGFGLSCDMSELSMNGSFSSGEDFIGTAAITTRGKRCR